jgi:hypothetical protein
MIDFPQTAWIIPSGEKSALISGTVRMLLRVHDLVKKIACKMRMQCE